MAEETPVFLNPIRGPVDLMSFSRKWTTPTGPHCQDCQTHTGHITAFEHSQPSETLCRNSRWWRTSLSLQLPSSPQATKFQGNVSWASTWWGERTQAGASSMDCWQSRRTGNLCCASLDLSSYEWAPMCSKQRGRRFPLPWTPSVKRPNSNWQDVGGKWNPAKKVRAHKLHKQPYPVL